LHSVDVNPLAGQELVDRVLRLVNERTLLMRAVAAWKWLHNSPVVDASREAAVMQQVSREAVTLGLAVGPVCQVFKVQIQCARAIQEHLHDRWRRHGFDHDMRVASLEEALRVRIDGLTRPLVLAMWVAVPDLASADFTDRASLGASRILELGWSAARKADLLAALGAIRF
jgi:chorismate mutase-like protein